MKDSVQPVLNEHLNKELYSAYLYFAIATYFEQQDYPGFAAWATRQAQEELRHAQKIHAYLLKSRAAVRLREIAGPPQQWPTLVDAIQAAYEHERSLGEDYRQVLELVRHESDFLTEPLILAFLTEQFDDEGNVDKLLQRVKAVKNDPTGLLVLDAQLLQAPEAS